MSTRERAPRQLRRQWLVDGDDIVSSVRATLRLSRRASYADYLAAEQNSASRHELLDGVVVAMAGGSDEHNALTGRLGGLCLARLAGSCRYYSPDQRFWIAATGHGRYSDGTIICGKPEHPAHDGQATTNPVVIFEVLAPSSEGDKRQAFQTLTSLQAYVLVAQDQRTVKVYRRDAGGAWIDNPTTYRHGEVLDLPTLESPLPVAEIYDNVLELDGTSALR